MTHLRLCCFDNVSACIRNALYDIGRHELAFVCDCCARRKHLYRGDLEVLTEGGNSKVCQIHAAHAVIMEEHIVALSGQVDACRL